MPITIVRRPFVVFAVTALLAGCGTQTPVVPQPRTQGPNITVAKIAPPAPAVPVTWPLTGVAVPEVAKRPALAVKIENPKEVRPQTGLDQADIVWEEVVEGGVTRLIAVYDSVVPGVVGPIRSVRPMDPAIVGPLHGIIAFSGGVRFYVGALQSAGVQTLSEDAGNAGFYRTKAQRAPHNVFGTPATFWAQADADHQAPPPAPFAFARHAEQATAVVSGKPATSVQIKMSGYSQPGWTWAPASGTWVRTEAGAAAMAASGVRLAATNVITLRVVLIQTGARDPANNPVPETKLVGSGEAVVATGGKMIAVTWSKDATASPLVLTAPDGQAVKLAPGKTWIELVPVSTGSVSVS